LLRKPHPKSLSKGEGLANAQARVDDSPLLWRGAGGEVCVTSCE